MSPKQPHGETPDPAPGAAPTLAPTLAEVQAARRLLEAVAGDRALLSALPMEERVALLRAAGAVARPTLEQVRKESRAVRRERRAAKRRADRETVEAAGIRAAREGPVFVPPPRLELPLDAGGGPELREPRDCYVCKQPYTRLHAFYDALCPACAALNYRKRFQSADLTGREALVTGARVKIGFHIALKLLRAGARVIATTRFPRDAVRRYAEEPDHAAWWERLEVVGLDLRHAPSVELFAEHLVRTRARLDVLVNNACQTVRRPPGFYGHLLEGELAPLDALPAAWRGPLGAWEALRGRLLAGEAAPALPAGEAPGGLPLAALEGSGARAPGLAESARLSQLRTAWDGADGFAVFPPGRTDQDQQQVDLRRHNSWRMTLAEVPAWEMLEVQLVNAVAPFILVSRLKPLLLRPGTREVHVINVSAMEGSFSRGTKTDRHPHTNMAKAGLNMLTLTSAPDYARDGIWMNAVDTGWVTDEDPAQHAERKRDQLGFQPPLDVVDGAARVLDPLFDGLLGGVHAWGKFFKDYAPTSW